MERKNGNMEGDHVRDTAKCHDRRYEHIIDVWGEYGEPGTSGVGNDTHGGSKSRNIRELEGRMGERDDKR